MGRRKKRGPKQERPEGQQAASPPERWNRPFARALEGMRVDADAERGSAVPQTMPPPGPSRPEAVPTGRPPPPEPPAGSSRTYEDRVAMSQALADVQPLAPRKGRGRRVSGAPEASGAGGSAASGRADELAADARARDRLDALVAGGVRFEVERDDGWVEGLRAGVSRQVLRQLRRRGIEPEAVIDLHGLASEQAGRELGRFVRDSHHRGRRLLLVVHGKGNHSEGGLGVLIERVLQTLTEGAAAPLVDAFVTAPARLGGTGALLVQLAAK